ncbi:BLUF domain-containing protein [Algicella marina]|uniref:BLUF domain-containing protein n=1 Tax=Algicella marina TaxID=2683284 RepID=UPI0024E01D5B|nr:BLUF domain-containing protein [Algicella marina]
MLQEVQARCRRNGLTGFIMAGGNVLVSVLEGGADQVIGALDEVARDRRHKGVTVLRESTVSGHRFVNFGVGRMDAPDQPNAGGQNCLEFAEKLARKLQHVS